LRGSDELKSYELRAGTKAEVRAVAEHLNPPEKQQITAQKEWMAL